MTDRFTTDEVLDLARQDHEFCYALLIVVLYEDGQLTPQHCPSQEMLNNVESLTGVRR